METDDVQKIAAQLLTGMLSNPHIYANVSDEESQGQQEQKLIQLAIEMAEDLVLKVKNRHPSSI